VVVTGAPCGVTFAVLKAQEAPATRPEQENETAELNPRCGVIVRVTATCCA
jgi:hypothetical protein